MRTASRVGEVVDQRLRIIYLEIDHPGELAFVVRIVRIKPFRDELRMSVVLCENDRLCEPIASGHAQTARHYVREDFVHCVLVEQPFVYRACLYAIWNLTFF